MNGPLTYTILIFLTVELIGGTSQGSGNVFATNPTTGIYGPVCDDNWDINDVSNFYSFFLFINIL